MTIVRYFAGAAAAAGTEEETLDLGTPTSVADLRGLLASRHQGLRPVLAVATLLVDEVAATDDLAEVGTARSIDVLPPFAGG